MEEEICEEIRNKLIVKELKKLVPDGYMVANYRSYNDFSDYEVIFRIYKIVKKKVPNRKLEIVGYKYHLFREDEPIEKWINMGTKIIDYHDNKAVINFTKKEMEIYDRNIYENLKKFGIKYKFNKLIKCWDGCEDE